MRKGTCGRLILEFRWPSCSQFSQQKNEDKSLTSWPPGMSVLWACAQEPSPAGGQSSCSHLLLYHQHHPCLQRSRLVSIIVKVPSFLKALLSCPPLRSRLSGKNQWVLFFHSPVPLLLSHSWLSSPQLCLHCSPTDSESYHVTKATALVSDLHCL